MATKDLLRRASVASKVIVEVFRRTRTFTRSPAAYCAGVIEIGPYADVMFAELHDHVATPQATRSAGLPEITALIG